MIKYKIRDQFRRKLFYEMEKEKLILKSLVQNLSLPFDIRLLLFFEYSKIAKKSSISLIKNRCVLTQRGRSVYGLFRLTRMQFRKLVGQQLIPGVRHSNW